MNPIALLLATAIALSGCSAISALTGATAPVQGLELRATDNLPRAARNTGSHIIVQVPDSSGALNTDQVLIRPNSYEASFLKGALWTTDVPLMVQTMMVRALQSSDGYGYVGREPLGLYADYAVVSELIDFQAEIVPALAGVETPKGLEEGMMAQARISILARVIDDESTRVIATRSFEAMVPAAADTPEAIGAALDTGMRSLLPQVTQWILGATGVRVK